MKAAELVKQVKNFFSNPARQMYAMAVIVFGCAVILLAWFSLPWVRGAFSRERDARAVVMQKKDERPALCEYRSALNGVCVSSEAEALNRVVAIMVENSIDAWPVSGLSKAGMVYEAPVEANIPRFLALYAVSTDVEAVGPVRSARPYFLDWAEEYGTPMYMHVGGSQDALDEIKKRKIFDINEMARGWYFWRDDVRHAPHNTYTSSRLWRSAFEKYGTEYPDTPLSPLVFKEIPPCESDCSAVRVTIRFSNPGYSADWKYNHETNRYERFQVDEETMQKDDDGMPIAADTVIVQRVHGAVLDAIGRLQLDTVGKGEATVFRGGMAIQGHWRKDSAESRTQFLDDTGNSIPLKSGKIWIEIVSQGGTVTLK